MSRKRIQLQSHNKERNQPPQLAFCQVCGECMGDAQKEGFANKHWKEFPDHNAYLTKWIIDPLNLPDIGEYVARLKEATTRNAMHDETTRR